MGCIHAIFFFYGERFAFTGGIRHPKWSAGVRPLRHPVTGLHCVAMQLHHRVTGLHRDAMGSVCTRPQVVTHEQDG